jgi:polysaccharide biosynthesis/export protein
MNSGARDPPSYTEGSTPAPSGVTAFAATGAVHSAAASQAADKFTSAATPGNSGYKIGPLDVLDVSVFQVPDMSKTVQVADNGSINYPLIGEVPAAGKTAHELENELAKKLGAKYLHSPQVTVFIKEYNSQRVTIEGAVKTSGVYAIKGRTTLSQIIAIAGGVDGSIASGDLVIFRTTNGTRSAARFDIDALLQGKGVDPELQPGDVIVANTSATKVALHNVLSVLPVAGTAVTFVPLM